MAFIPPPANEKGVSDEFNQGIGYAESSKTASARVIPLALKHPYRLIVINAIAVTTIAVTEIEAASSDIFRKVNHSRPVKMPLRRSSK